MEPTQPTKPKNHRPTTRPLRSLDLFSGIGGLTLALTGIASPLAYCDVEPAAIAVLTDQMRRGGLPPAPVCPDVRLLRPAWLRQQQGSTKGSTKGSAKGSTKMPEAIVAGFPCVGFSLVGQREGYENEESGLFAEILRLIDEHASVRFLFLENVAQFVHDGLGLAIAELHLKRGFELRWCCAEARDVGAPQRRRRWFCLGVRGADADRGAAAGLLAGRPTTVLRSFARRWLTEPPHRTVCARGSKRLSPASVRARCSLLGNAVVPDCARAAFLHLASPDAGPVPARVLDPSVALRLRRLGRARASDETRARWPAHGCASRGVLYSAPPMPPPRFRPPVWIVLNNAFYKPPPGYAGKNTLDAVRGDTRLEYWATPRASMLRPAHVRTVRTTRDLPTQVRNEARTPDEERPCKVHPEFVEWLMGYPRGWTAAAENPHP